MANEKKTSRKKFRVAVSAAGLRDLNVKEEDFAVLATNALKDACGFTNPIQATHEEIVAIYRAAM